jgi:hypothetical protein
VPPVAICLPVCNLLKIREWLFVAEIAPDPV